MEKALLFDEKNKLSRERQVQDSILIWTWLQQKSPLTQAAYKKIVSDFFGFFSNVGLAEVTPAHITLYLKQKKELAPATLSLIKNTMSSLFTFAVKTGRLAKNPALLLDRIKVPDQFGTKTLSHEQLQQMLLKEKSLRNRLLLEMLYQTGLRVSELCHTRVRSIQEAKDGQARVTVIGKGQKVRVVLITEELWKVLKKHIKEADLDKDHYLLHDPQSRKKPMSRQGVYKIIKTMALRAGIKPLPSPHWLRHTSATHAIENGAPIHVVQKTLGHASMSTTGKYLDVRPQESSSRYLKPLK